MVCKLNILKVKICCYSFAKCIQLKNTAKIKICTVYTDLVILLLLLLNHSTHKFELL